MVDPNLARHFQDFQTLGAEEVRDIFRRFDVREEPGGNILGVRPAGIDEIRRLVEIASSYGVPILTTPLDPFASLGAGPYLLLDFASLEEIARIDSRNLVASVGRGVTFSRFFHALKEKGLKCTVPVFPSSPYVLESNLNRDITFQAVKHHEAKASCQTVVLADGKVHYTGVRALGEGVKGTMGRDCGPYLSRWYFGARDTLGIPVEQLALAYPVYDAHRLSLIGFDALAGALGFMREAGIRDLATELFAMNREALEAVAGIDPSTAPGWTVAVGSETFGRLCAYQQETARRIATSRYSGKLLAQGTEAVLELVQVPKEEVRAGRISYFAHVSKVPALVAAAERHCGGASPTFVVSYQSSRSFVVLHELAPDAGLVRRVSVSLYEMGAFFDLPTGSLEERILNEDETYMAQLRKIKSFMDPKNILNPLSTIQA